MPLRLLLETPNLLISHDTANDWLYVNWQGRHDQEPTRNRFGAASAGGSGGKLPHGPR